MNGGLLKPEEYGAARDFRGALISDLKTCGNLKELKRGKILHAAAIDSGDYSNIYVANTLVSMYAKCESMREARQVFDGIPKPSVVSWNALILGYAENGEPQTSLKLFECMEARSALSFVAALKACTYLIKYEQAKGNFARMEEVMAVHSLAAQSGWQSQIYVSSTLVDVYAKCGSMRDAHETFDRMETKNVVVWNALMLGYVENGECEKCLKLFHIMRSEGCDPDALSFVAALKSCSALSVQASKDGKPGSHLEEGIHINMDAVKCGCHREHILANMLIDMYTKCGSMVDAQLVFHMMPDRSVVSWNALMLGYAEFGNGNCALKLFASMRSEGFAPEPLSFIAALKACSSLAVKGSKQAGWNILVMAMSIHSQAVHTAVEWNVFLANTLVDTYGKCGSMADARKAFDIVPCQSVVSWNSLILGYAENGQEKLALEMFFAMKTRGLVPDAMTFVAAFKACSRLDKKKESLEKGMAIHFEGVTRGCDSNLFVASTLIEMYSKCGSMVDARLVFNKMVYHNVVCWNALMLGYVDNDQPDLALKLFKRMGKDGYIPDAVSYVAALRACSLMGALEIGISIHAKIRSSCLEREQTIACALVDFYGRCGCLSEAHKVFDSCAKNDFMSFTALLTAYSRQGNTDEVFRLFYGMKDAGFEPDGVICLCVLTACNHAGLVDRGKEFFEAMSPKYGIAPGIGHYCCMVDMLGRANQLDIAVEMVKGMSCEPDAVTWLTVLNACKKWENVEVGRLAFDALLRLDEKDSKPYILMESIYRNC